MGSGLETGLDITPAAEQLIARRRIWQAKYAIRACYRGWYERMRPYIAAGPSLEVGAGSGDFRSFWPDLMITDIVSVPWLDVVADGMRLPVADSCLANLVVIDLLHHLPDPHALLDESSRVLRPGGRLLAIEPYITPVSYLAYRLLHHEDVWFHSYQKPVLGPAADAMSKSDPWQGNLALPNLLFGRGRREWPRRHPDLRILRASKFSLLDFQLAGGFKPFALVGHAGLYDALARLDRRLDPIAGLCGFRIFVVIEKAPSDGQTEVS
jgi:SAM-dependent methyltransferase